MSDLAFDASRLAGQPSGHGRRAWWVARLSREWHDARTWQILALGTLLIWNLTQLSLGASPLHCGVAIACAAAAQLVAVRLIGKDDLDLRSPLITGLSLSLLLRGDGLWVPAAAACVAIGSKFLIRAGGKHVFNPAALAIVVMLGSGHAWVSPGQWGHSTFLVALIGFFAVLVLTRASRLDIALAFISAYGLALFARAAWLGDPVAIPLHQLQNGALPLFACFMITDPRTAPKARFARLAAAVAAAAVAHWLLFGWRMSSGLYAALVLVNLLTPLLDRVFPAASYRWAPKEKADEPGHVCDA